jgi:L-threonylcarbamoyladenylate synthase
MSISPFLSNCSVDSICDAAAVLKAGHLVAFPTETVYGLGADARNPEAVKRVYDVKGRPNDHPLIVHISSINHLEKWAREIPDYAISLARAFWPGPMTLILKRSEIVRDFITGGQDSVGLRVPSDPIALALIKEFEKISDSAIAAPSANRFGQVSPTSSADVYEELGEFLSTSDLILDGGNSPIGIESTIVDCTGEGPIILRNGAVTQEDIDTELGISSIAGKVHFQIKFSGSFDKHYAPKCKIILDNLSIQGGAFFALANIETPIGMIRLNSPTSIEEFAQSMYSTFRIADRDSFESMVVCPPDGGGMAVAIRERLFKAARGR